MKKPFKKKSGQREIRVDLPRLLVNIFCKCILTLWKRKELQPLLFFFVLNISVLVLFPIPLPAQITLEKEEFVSGKYRLTFANTGTPYSIQETGGKRTVRFDFPMDESKEGTFSLPQKDIFIALPPNSRPSITVRALKRELIVNARPEITPKVYTIGDSLVLYKQASEYDTEILRSAQADNEKMNVRRHSLFILRGYLWIGNSYCAHLTLYPYEYDMANNTITVVQEFGVETPIPNGTSFGEQRNMKEVNPLIVNTKYGLGWQANKPGYIIPPSDSWIDYTQGYLKIGVARDGIYRLSFPDLQSYGIPTGSPQYIRMYLKGNEIPIYVGADFIEFLGRRNYGDTRYREIAPYGTPYYEYLNRYSDTTIYWLSWGGNTIGKRIDTTVVVQGIPADTTKYYDEFNHIENNVWLDYSSQGSAVRREDPEYLENETWQEGNLNVGILPIQFSVADMYPNKPARAFVKLQDISSNINVNAHDLALSINTNVTKYDSGFINKYDVKVLKADFASGLLKNGTNTVNIHSFATANTVNTVIRDWYELEYPRYLKTSTDSLNFSFRYPITPVLSVVTIKGATAPAMSLYKFKASDSTATKITNYARNEDTLRFTDTVAAGNFYFLLSEQKIPAPIIFYKKKFVHLRDANNQADYIAITPPYFQSLATSYCSFISTTYGVTTKLINVYDIYDEFNYGFFAPEPIRDFLKSTQVYWQLPSPRYVFLIGKGTYDFYGNKTKYFGAPVITNFVPSFGDPVSDPWFVIWDSTGTIPQMNIGRVPAKNLTEFQSYFSKHQKYVSQGFDDWNKRYLFFAGGNFTDPGQIAQSKGTNDQIINTYINQRPIGGKSANFYKTINPITNFGPYSPEYIKGAIDQGGIFISYIGHSGTQTWDNSITDASQLANVRDRYPMVTDFGCSTAKHAEPDVLSFSELFVNDPQGQAIAYIGNSSLGFTSTAFTFPQFFYKRLLADTTLSIGEAHRLAKLDFIRTNSSSDSYKLFLKTNSIIGDPIVHLPVPTKPNFSFTNAQITINPQQPTEQIDSVLVNINYFNLGKVIGDSIEILVKDEYQGAVIYSRLLKRVIPMFSDSLSLSLFVKGKPGEHRILLTLDPANKYDEIYENDNSVVYAINVASTSIRSLTLSPVANQTQGTILFLNPSVKPALSNFFVDVSLNSAFTQNQTYQVPYDTFFTTFTLDTLYRGKRVWMRAKYDASNLEGVTYSYVVGKENNYFFNDSVSFSKIKTTGTKISDNGIALDTTKIVLSTISAGANDGLTAVISRNNQNFVPENTLRGHHVVLFNATTLEFLKYYRFDIFSGTAVATSYKTFIDTLTSDYIVAIAVSDEGSQNLTAALKTSVKTLGSIFIDSLVFRSSWALIGRKGSLPGTVPEKFSKPFGGRVQIDTTIIIPNNTGTYETEEIGPVARWKNAKMKYSNISSGSISMTMIGIKPDKTRDTLGTTVLSDSIINLTSVNAQQYPSLKFLGAIKRNPGQISPSINSIEINFDQLAELGTNYQAVKTYRDEIGKLGKELNTNDTVMQGEKVWIKFRVYNVGGVAAKNFIVGTSSLWDTNHKETIADITVDSLNPKTYKEFLVPYNTSLGYGRRFIQITIDSANLVPEVLKDNNFFSFPIVVHSDTLRPELQISFDGEHVVNGDYVGQNPEVQILYSDNNPSSITIADTSRFKLRLNNNPVYFTLGGAELITTSSPEKAQVHWRPSLAEGENIIQIFAKDVSGNSSDTTTLFVNVSSTLNLFNVYNFPNPFPKTTDFTFTIAGPINADEVTLKIYTVAGRLIHTITAPGRVGFNKIFWDGRDKDGDEVGNGVYLYKIIVREGEKQTNAISKLVKMR
ncbi:MAG: C25 family cysteine peptidase [Bacteroidota bacterium]|nr:C25 family cysteine peptidase [Bacteroidota bacterium]